MIQTRYSILTEAELRSAISRSYYAAFHVAKDYLYKTRCYIAPGSGVEGSSRDNPSPHIAFMVRYAALTHPTNRSVA